MISQILNPSNKIVKENVLVDQDVYGEELWRPEVSKAEVNASTALALAERDDLPHNCIPDLLEYISFSPHRKNTKFKAVTEVHNLLTSADATGLFRFFGTGLGRYINLTSGAYNPGSSSINLGAYTSAKAVCTKVTLYSSDSGLGNELYTIADVYKLSSDQFTRSYRSKGNSRSLSEFKCNLTTHGDVSFIIRGSWSIPLNSINPITGFNASHIMASSAITFTVTVNTKPLGVVSNYLILNGNTGTLTLTPRVVNRYGIVTNGATINVFPQSHVVYSSVGEIVEFVGDVGPFIIAMEAEYAHAGEDIVVDVTSNNGVVSAILETIYEVEIGESFQGDILSDDNLRYYSHVDDYVPRPLRARVGYANMGAIVSSILSTAAAPLFERAKDTWKNFSYKEDKGLWSNLKSFLSKFAGVDSRKGMASLDGGPQDGDSSLTKDRYLRNERELDLSSGFTVHKLPTPSDLCLYANKGYASTSVMQENKLRLFKKAANTKVKPTGESDPYKSKNFFPTLDAIGLSPFLSSLKTRFEGGYGNVIKVAFPTGFQYFPAVTEDRKNVVVCAVIKTTTPAPNGATYGATLTVDNTVHYFDARFEITEKMFAKIGRYLTEDGGSYKDKYASKYYYTFESGQPKVIDYVTDESWLAAWMLTVDDAPDGSFITGSFEYSEYGFIKGMYMAPEVIKIKNTFVNHLIVLSDEKHCYETGVPPYDATGVYLGAAGGTTCISKLSLWIVATLDWNVRGITRTTYIENRVFYPYAEGTTVYDNFHKQISILKMGEGKMKGGKYENYLAGDWLGLTRLPHPMQSLIGIKFRNVNTFNNPANIAASDDASYMDSKIDEGKLNRYLSYGYKDADIVMFKVAKVAESGVYVNWRDLDANTFTTADPTDIMKSILQMRGQTSINALVSNRKINFDIDNPIALFLHNLCNNFDPLFNGATAVLQLKTIIVNARRILTKENLSKLITKDVNGYHTVIEDKASLLYYTDNVYNTKFFFIAEELSDIVRNYVRPEKQTGFKSSVFQGGYKNSINHNSISNNSQPTGSLKNILNQVKPESKVPKEQPVPVYEVEEEDPEI